MNSDLEKLIDLAIADGVLTDKEKQILFKKAEALGVDMDEFEMVLDARLHLRQKDGTSSKQKDNVIKCPSCNDIVPALSKVCPSCGFVIDSGKKSSASEKGLEDLISDIEDTLVQIKSIRQPNIFTKLFDHSYISLPILSVIMFVIGFRLNSPVGFIGLILAFLSWRVIKKKMREGKREDKSPSFDNLKATFEKHSRIAKTLFGENRKVRLLLEELNNELNVIDTKRKKEKTIEYVFYGIIALITVGVFFIPQKETEQIISLDEALAKHDFVAAKESLDKVRKECNYVDKEICVNEMKRKIAVAESNYLVSENLFDSALSIIDEQDEETLKLLFSSGYKGSKDEIRDNVLIKIVEKMIDKNDLNGANKFALKIKDMERKKSAIKLIEDTKTLK